MKTRRFDKRFRLIFSEWKFDSFSVRISREEFSPPKTLNFSNFRQAESNEKPIQSDEIRRWEKPRFSSILKVRIHLNKEFSFSFFRFGAFFLKIWFEKQKTMKNYSERFSGATSFCFSWNFQISFLFNDRSFIGSAKLSSMKIPLWSWRIKMIVELLENQIKTKFFSKNETKFSVRRFFHLVP